jgi:hypothetical protein
MLALLMILSFSIATRLIYKTETTQRLVQLALILSLETFQYLLGTETPSSVIK